MFVALPSVASLPESQQISWDVAKQIIQSQSNLAIIGITVLVGVAVLVMAASWVWNFYLHKHELERAIESFKLEMVNREKEHFAELTEKVKGEVIEAKQAIENSIEEKIALFKAEEARLFAITAFNAKLHEPEACWWARAIERYAKVNKPDIVRIAVDHLNTALKKCKKLEVEDEKSIKSHLSFIPSMLKKEKKEIEDKLDKLPNEIAKEIETDSEHQSLPKPL